MSNRRAFITLLGGAATLPLVARAQQLTMPVLGFLASGSFDTQEDYVAAVRKGLSEAGYSEQRNIRIDYQAARAQYDKAAVARCPSYRAARCCDRNLWLSRDVSSKVSDIDHSDYIHDGR